MVDFLAFLGDPDNDFPPELAERVRRLSQVSTRLIASSDPEVVLTSLARLCVPVFSDGCSVELLAAGRQIYRIRFPRGSTRRHAGGTAVVRGFDHADEGGTVRTTITRKENSFGDAFHGEMLHVWNQHRPGRDDCALAGVLLDRALDIIEERRLIDALAQAEALTARMKLELATRAEIAAVIRKLHRVQIDDPDSYGLLRHASGEEADPFDTGVEPGSSAH